MAPNRQRLSQRRTESGKIHPATTPALLPQRPSEVWLNRFEFETLISPQVIGSVETLESADAGVEDPDPHEPALPTMPLTVPLAGAATDVQPRRMRSRWFTRFAAVGILALAGGAAGLPLITSRSGPSPRSPPRTRHSPPPWLPSGHLTSTTPAANSPPENSSAHRFNPPLTLPRPRSPDPQFTARQATIGAPTGPGRISRRLPPLRRAPPPSRPRLMRPGLGWLS